MEDVKNYFLEKLRKEQEAAGAQREDLTQQQGLMNIARGLTFNTKGVESPDAFIAQQQELAGQGTKDLLEQQKVEQSAAEQVRAALLAKLQQDQFGQKKENDLTARKLERDRLALDSTKAEREAGDRTATAFLKDKELELQRMALENKQSAPAKEPTQGQFTAGTFARRTDQAQEVLDKLAKEGYNRSSTLERLQSLLPGEFQSSSRQQQDQAERNFVNAVLRKESGAAISPSEFASAELQYFDRPGDSKEVRAQKAASRRQAIEALKAEAGPALDRIPAVSVASSTAPLNAEEKKRLEFLRAKRGQ